MKALSFLFVGMFLILFTLQLCGVIAWSWWLVAAPLLVWVGIPFTILVVSFVICVLCLGIAGTFVAVGEEVGKKLKR